MPGGKALPNLSRATTLPRLVISAPQGRSGKTTLSLGLCGALVEQGWRVQPFKKGPDYIDPSWLSAAAGRACRCLDTFFIPSPDDLRAAFLHGTIQAEFALIEGNHGLYDSLEEDGAGSTAAVARVLEAPILLVVNATRMSRSAAAMVHGYQTFEPDTPIAGVVLNNVAQARHESKLRRAIESACGIPVVGALPRDTLLTIPDRHLGLVPQGEDERLIPALNACKDTVNACVDLDAVIKIAGGPEKVEGKPEAPEALPTDIVQSRAVEIDRPRIGVIRDQVFSFYYQENLDALEEHGAELIFINALQDPHLPAIQALYIGGGFPEIFMNELNANQSLRREVRKAVQSGMPVYAECGGLMYLGQSIQDQNRVVEMCGALPYSVEMTSQPQGHGYVLGEFITNTPIFEHGARLRGHEFHHSRLVPEANAPAAALRLERGNGIGGHRDGLVYGNVYTGYTHVHAYGSPGWAPGLIAAARGTMQ